MSATGNKCVPYVTGNWFDRFVLEIDLLGSLHASPRTNLFQWQTRERVNFRRGHKVEAWFRVRKWSVFRGIFMQHSVLCSACVRVSIHSQLGEPLLETGCTLWAPPLPQRSFANSCQDGDSLRRTSLLKARWLCKFVMAAMSGSAKTSNP